MMKKGRNRLAKKVGRGIQKMTARKLRGSYLLSPISMYECIDYGRQDKLTILIQKGKYDLICTEEIWWIETHEWYIGLE